VYIGGTCGTYRAGEVYIGGTCGTYMAGEVYIGGTCGTYRAGEVYIGGTCGTYRAGEVYIGFGGETDGEKPLGRPMLDVDNIKMNLQEVEWEDMDWIYINQDRNRWRELFNAVMNLRLP
jgi:hypothetical protein